MSVSPASRCSGYVRAATFGIAALVFVAAFASAAAAPDDRLRVRVEDGLLTVDADAVPLAEVVEAIGRQAGFETTLIGDVSALVTVSLAKMPLAEGLERLLGDTDRILIYAAPQADAIGPRIAQLWLYGPENGQEMTAAAPPSSPEPLLDPDGKIRSQAVLRLTQAGATEDALDQISQVLREDADPLVRSRAAIALGSLGDRRGLAALEAALADRSFSVRVQAIQALGQIGGEQASQVLGDVLLYERDPQMRTLAALALHREGSPRAQRLLEAAADDPDQQVRSAAANPPSRVSRSDWPAAGEDKE
jgi:HEAT repeats